MAAADPTPAARALARLRAGHRRFLERLRGDPPSARLELPQTHRPFAAVLGCADARTAPETIFDAPLGQLFVVRTAGQVPGREGLASLEFAVAALGVPLIVVLGHTRCGALEAAVKPGSLPGHLKTLVDWIRAGLQDGPAEADAAAAPHVRRVLAALREGSPVLERARAEGRLRLAGAVYDVASGKLSWL